MEFRKAPKTSFLFGCKNAFYEPPKLCILTGLLVPIHKTLV